MAMEENGLRDDTGHQKLPTEVCNSKDNARISAHEEAAPNESTQLLLTSADLSDGTMKVQTISVSNILRMEDLT